MRSDWACLAAGLWGFAEATFFFVVPDVLLMFLAAPRFSRAFVASLYALLGALAGGALMYLYGFLEPERARVFLVGVPAIQTSLIEDVRHRIEVQAWVAVLQGPLRGTPYKIFAVEWGVAHHSGLLFLLISIPARYVRFLLSPLCAAGLYRVAGRLARHVLVCGWIIFYALYFYKFGW